MENKHQNGRFTCDRCTEMFVENNERTMHIVEKLGATQPQCDQCGQILTDMATLRKHVLQTHKSFRPCRNYVAQGSQCKYREACHFSHVAVAQNMQRCYKCGVEVLSVTSLMEHRNSIL